MLPYFLQTSHTQAQNIAKKVLSFQRLRNGDTFFLIAQHI